VTYENDSEGVAINYAVVGEAVRCALSKGDSNEELFSDDWAGDIEKYHRSKNERKGGKRS